MGLQHFAAISKTDFFQFVLKQGLVVEQFEDYMIEEALEIITVPTFYQARKGLIFLLLEPEEFEDEYYSTKFEGQNEDFFDFSQNLVPIVDGGVCMGPLFLSTGFRVSSWLTDSLSHCGTLLPRFVDLNISCLGRGFGSWDRTFCIGTNIYHGGRSSNCPCPSPIEGVGWSQQSEYYREGYKNWQFFPVIHSEWKLEKRCVMDFCKHMDYHMTKLLCSKYPSNENNGVYDVSPCKIGIVTCGNKSTLGFANTPHMDKGDIISVSSATSIK